MEEFKLENAMENIEETKIESLVNNLPPIENKIYYSKRLNGFLLGIQQKEYLQEEDIEISREEHISFTQGISEGKLLCLGEDGYPTLKDRDPPTQEEIDTLNRRLRSFAYTEESDPLFYQAQRGEATIEEWKAKIEEIKLRYPVSKTEPEPEVSANTEVSSVENTKKAKSGKVKNASK